jgi:hypothetical protein
MFTVDCFGCLLDENKLIMLKVIISNLVSISHLVKITISDVVFYTSSNNSTRIVDILGKMRWFSTTKINCAPKNYPI